MKNIEEKRNKEKLLLLKMVEIYCRKNHHSEEGLCTSCQELRDYGYKRVDKCPFMETKTFCANCKVHCYKEDMRKRVKEVMKFSGPRLLLYHPIIVLKHFFYTGK